MLIDNDAIISHIYKNDGMGDIECAECPFHQCWNEHHPYGSTFAIETLCECTVLDRATINDCPAYPIYLETLADELQTRKEELG